MRRTWFRFAPLILGLAVLRSTAGACTLWAAVEDNRGGTLISKNRDWKPDHTQVLKLHRDAKSYAYFGLYAEGNNDPGLKEGVNEKGLCVVSASSCIPEATRRAQSNQRGVMPILLAKYATCDEIFADQKKLFGDRRPTFLLISDREKILTVEIGMKGQYVVRVTESGAAAHTNHYLSEAMAACNAHMGSSSEIRLRRINALLAFQPHTAAAFATMSRDRHDGPDNSLWRTGTKTATLSSWILKTPAHGAPQLRVVIANPGEPEQTRTFALDDRFWTAPAPAPIADGSDGDN